MEMLHIKTCGRQIRHFSGQLQPPDMTVGNTESERIKQATQEVRKSNSSVRTKKAEERK